MATFGDELQVESRVGSSFPPVALEEPSSLMEFLLLDVRLVVHRDRLGVILGLGNIEGYDAALIVAGVAGIEWGARPWKGWHNWIVGEVRAETSAGQTTATIGPMFMQHQPLRIRAESVEVRLGTSPLTAMAPPDYVDDTEEEIWAGTPGWGSEFTVRAATLLHNSEK